jgi:DegV family protein with EDD domain
MSKVAIVTDSTAFIPKNMMNGHNITIVPLQVIWGEKTYLDGIDIQPDQFYERLSSAKIMPSTSQVTPSAFEAVYKSLLETGHDIFSIHISSKLSGTLDSAIQAKSAFPGAKIELFDSEGTSMILGFQVLALARAIEQGAALQDCKAIAEKARPLTNALFVVKTLEFLHRGGRIGGAAAFLGTALNLKPILSLSEGRIEAIERVRTINKAVDRMLDLLEERTNGHTPIRIAVLHANAMEDAVRLLGQIRERYHVSDLDEAFITGLSPVIGTHTGPGTLGIAYMAGM